MILLKPLSQAELKAEILQYKSGAKRHTAGFDTIFVQIYMDPPPGVPGVLKKNLNLQNHYSRATFLEKWFQIKRLCGTLQQYPEIRSP